MPTAVRLTTMSPLPLFKAELWRTALISLRRFHRDKRARRFAYKLAGLLLYLGLYFRFFLWRFVYLDSRASQADHLMELCLLAMVLVGVLMVFALQRWQEHRDRTPPPSLKQSAELATEQHDTAAAQLWQQTVTLAALLQRSGSESSIKTTVLPANREVATRRWLRERLLALQVWERLPRALLELLILPDGHWTEEVCKQVDAALPYLPVLRWALGFDRDLPPLDRLPQYNAAMLRSLLDGSPTPHPLLPPWELRIARDSSNFYFQRFWVEAVTRRLVGKDLSPDQIADAATYKQEIDNDGTVFGDLLVGAHTVSELEDPALMTMVLASYRRWELLQLLTDIAGGEADPVQVERLLFGLLLSSTLEPSMPV